MIFITGATGLVGTHLLELLLHKKYEVKALIRKEEDKKLFRFDTKNVHWVVGDVLDINILDEALKGVKKVIHCAAIVSYASQRVFEMRQVNIEGTANIVNLCLENNIEKLCYISSIASLDPDKVTGIISEKTHLDESSVHSEYARSKYYAELEVWRGIEEGLNAVILNPTIILGPSDWEKSSTKIFKYVWDEHQFYIAGGYNFIDVRDVVHLSCNIINSDKKNVQYILSGENSSYKLLFEKIATQFNKKPPTIKAGKFLKRLVLCWSNIVSLFSSKEPIITKDAINRSDKTPTIDNTKIELDFPYKYHSLEDTIAWTCAELVKK